MLFRLPGYAALGIVGVPGILKINSSATQTEIRVSGIHNGDLFIALLCLVKMRGPELG